MTFINDTCAAKPIKKLLNEQPCLKSVCVIGVDDNETAAAVLNFLYQQREQSKQAIYEITGISDIVRGASHSSETATAQQIKTEWGSLRIKKILACAQGVDFCAQYAAQIGLADPVLVFPIMFVSTNTSSNPAEHRPGSSD